MKEPTKKQKIGRLGEDVAVKYLENKGFSVIERNYLKKCGEIDIIAKKAGVVHFIEVKSVSELANSESADSCLGHKRTAGFTAWPQTLGRSETPKELRQNIYDSHRRGLCSGPGNVPLRPRREFANSETDVYRPEDNLHPYKLKRLARTIQLYLFERHSNGDPEWQFDAITVRLDMGTRRAKVEFLGNIIL